jgi:hypothetical protein
LKPQNYFFAANIIKDSVNMARFKEFFKYKIRENYRLIVRNDETLQEKISFVLSPLNLILLVSGVFMLFTILILSLIFYTPLQEFVPGAANQVDLRDRIEMKQKIDSLESIAQMMTRERENLQAILKGEPLNNPGSASDSLPETEDLNLEEISESEKKFRKMMEEEFTEDGLNGAEKISGNTLKNLAFFTPIRGFISDTFDKKSNHLAVDIVAPKNAPVKATLDGSVVISTWTPETGHVIAIQHSNDLISVYKHNSVLLKKTGAYVSAGEVIALVGNSGELTSGPHLHFELWYNGSPVDPRYYLNF